MYGVGEVPQAFCRLCAVFGGTYMLRQRIDGFLTADDGGRCSGIVLNGKPVESTWVVTTAGCLPTTYPASTCGNRVSRAVLITDSTLVPEADENQPVVTLCVPPETAGNANNVNAFVYSEDSAACPSGRWLTQMVTKGTDASAKTDLEHVVGMLTQQPGTAATRPEDGKPSNKSPTKPNLLYSMYFSMDTEGPRAPDGPHELSGLVISNQPPPDSVNFQAAVAEARRMFELICPGEEFLPTAPNPEDIDWGPPQLTAEEMDARLTVLEKDAVQTWIGVGEITERLESVRVRGAQSKRSTRTDTFEMVRTAIDLHSMSGELAAVRARLTLLNRRVDAIAPLSAESIV